MPSRIDVPTADDLADALAAAHRRLPQTRTASAPTVSVVICAYTGARRDELLEAIESLRRQTRAPREVIVVIDHNTELLGWVRSHAPDVLAIANRKERGLSGARNSGVRTARGDVVAFLDDDAAADPNWVERITSAFRDPAILGVGGAVMPVWERRPAWFPDEFAWVVGCSYRGLPLEPTPVRNLIGCNMSFRRQVFEQLGGFTTRLGRVAGRPVGCEETELCIRIRRQAPSRTILYDPGPGMGVHHRVPRQRATWRYFVSRCYGEGISKAELSRMTGRERGLASERAFTFRTLPTGVLAELKAGRPARAAAIVVGFCATLAGFLSGKAFGRPAVTTEPAVSAEPATAVGCAMNVAAVADPIQTSRPVSRLVSSNGASTTTTATIVVATCGRPRELARCLRSLLAQSRPAERIVVVDDAPGGDATPLTVELCANGGPPIVYVEGRGGGLADAHNRGLPEVASPIVAFADDDVIADQHWLARLIDGFASAPDVGCVTGKIVPLELETPAQVWLDGYAGFNKGSERRIFDLGENRPDDPLFPFTAGSLGSGANMAFSLAALQDMGGFDPALGAGTRARGGDDLAAFLDVILRGYKIVYEPGAVVHHGHPRDYEALRNQVYCYGVGLTAYLTKSLLDRPRLLAPVARQLPRAIAHALSPRSSRNSRRPGGYPRELTHRERLGMVAGPMAYLRSRRQVGGR